MEATLKLPPRHVVDEKTNQGTSPPHTFMPLLGKSCVRNIPPKSQERSWNWWEAWESKLSLIRSQAKWAQWWVSVLKDQEPGGPVCRCCWACVCCHHLIFHQNNCLVLLKLEVGTPQASAVHLREGLSSVFFVMTACDVDKYVCALYVWMCIYEHKHK